MIKLIQNTYNFEEPTLQVIHPGNIPLIKCASEMTKYMNAIKPKDGFTYALVLALGAGEAYGCFAAGTSVAMETGEYTPIEHVQVGDLVISGDGNIRPVLSLFRRTVPEGKILSVSGLRDSLRCSNNHPFEVARKGQFKCKHDSYKRCLPIIQGEQCICSRVTPRRSEPWTCVTSPYQKIITEYSRADELEAGDFLIWTTPNVEPAMSMCVDEAYILGAWLAEGSFQYNASNKQVSSIILALHLEESEFLTKLEECAAKCDLNIKNYPCPERSHRSVTITGNPSRFRQWRAEFRCGSKTKIIPPWVCCLPRSTRLAILAGYADGDGHFAVSDKESRLIIRTHGKDLARGIQRLCWSLGFPTTLCSVNEGITKSVVIQDRSVVTYGIGTNISIATSYLEPLKPFSWKLKTRELKQTTKVHSFYHQGKMYLPIRSIKNIEEPFDVYNIEVEEDHTYTVENVSTRNSNRNGDYFEEKELISRHHTFETHGHVYKHHKNKDPKKAYGKIIKAVYNKPMMRTELIIEINNRLAPNEVRKISDNSDVPVSMAAKVPYDICSICGNKSKTRGQYCDHLRNQMTQILPDGRQVYALNPTPTFFDISFVFRPADRIAYVLKKVASAESVIPSVYLAEMEGLTDSHYGDLSPDHMRKLSTLRKLSDIEKEIEGVIGKIHPETTREKLVLEDAPKALTCPCQSEDISEEGDDPIRTLGGLASKGIIMGPDNFSKLIFGSPMQGLKASLPGIFSKLLHSSELPDILSNNLFNLRPHSLLGMGKNHLNQLMSDHSLFSKPSVRRILKITIVSPSSSGVKLTSRGASIPSSYGFGGGVLKSSEDRTSLDNVAVAYALYKIAAVSMNDNLKDDMLPLLTVLQHYVK